MSLTDLIPAGTSPSPEHTDVMLEIAYLTTAVDGRLDDDELDAFREIAAKLRGKAVSNVELDALLDKFAGHVEPAEILERVKAIAPTLPGDLRPVAFKLAVGLSVADLDANEDETDLQIALAEALGFDDDKVAELNDQVYTSLGGGEGGDE